MLASGPALGASAPATAWEKNYGGSENQKGNGVWQTDDNGFIIVGTVPDDSNTGTNLYLLKVDAAGNQVWSKKVGGSYGYSVRQTTDGGYIAVGAVSDDLYLAKTDKNGNKQWDKTFGGHAQTIGHSVQQTSDGGYIVAGQVAAGGASEWEAYVLKVDASGNKVWEKIISNSISSSGDIFPYTIWQTFDGGYILGGVIETGYNAKPCLIKLDGSGNVQWTKAYENPEDQWANFGGDWVGVQQTRDSGYIYAGVIGDKTYLMKTDASGNKQWDKAYDYVLSGATSVQQTWDNGYVLAGYYRNVDQEADKVLVIRTDASGNEQWHQMYSGQKYAEGNSVLQIGTGSFVVAGWTSSTPQAADSINNIYLLQIGKDMTPSPNAKVVSDTIPAKMEAGQAYNVQVTFENTGTMPWTYQDNTTFGHYGDAAKFGVTGSNQTVTVSKVIRPGMQETWAFTMTAPGENGTYNPRFQMMWEGHNPFGAVDNKTIVVVNGTGPAVGTATAIVSAQATVEPATSATATPAAASTQATAAPSPKKTSDGSLPCLSSMALPLLAVGAVTISWTMRKKKGDQ